MPFRRLLPWVVVALAGLPNAHGQSDVTDPVFSAVPFDQWMTEGEQTHFHWSVHVGGAELGSHQRLQTRVEVQVDGNELVSRRGHGQLMILIQFEDSAERVYQTHGMLDLQDVKDEVSKSNIQYIQDALVLPGDYHVGVAIFDTQTKEHGAARKQLRVSALRNDPLPEAWKGLPAVELLHGLETPDSWFLPYVTGRLHLPLATRRPIQIEILMNASASGPSRGLSVGTVSNRSLANMLPALKVLSQVDMAGSGPNITLLDIPKRNVMYQQDAVHTLDWTRLRQGLTAADPNKIDVRALEHSEQNAQYFVEQVHQRLAADGAERTSNEPFRVLIILTPPMSFSSGEDKRPIEPVGKPSKVFYVRYHLPPERLPVTSELGPFSRNGRRNNPRTAQPQTAPEAFDSIEPLLKPLQPRVFEVYTPDQFRKALSSMLDEIARL